MSASLISVDAMQTFVAVNLIGYTSEETVPISSYISQLNAELFDLLIKFAVKLHVN
jgi:uncharacterized membrane protein